MIQIIETNLSIDNNNTIRDHQSRIIEAEDWGTYCKAYREYNGEAIYFKSKNMKGNSIQSNSKISNLQIDDYHLSCDITKYNDGKIIFTDKRLAYNAF